MTNEKTIKKGIYRLGEIDYQESGKENCLCTFEYELKESDKGLCFTMHANIWMPTKHDIYCGGQCCDDVAAYFPDDAKAQQMLFVWQGYHLNDLTAGCEHQRAAGWDHTKNESLLSKPCPVCGYEYGSAWLHREIPEDVINIIKSW